jgi:TetR/AcrR family transcriptional regulator, transcriptional repressor for nem operon
MMMARNKAPEDTRQAILSAAFQEFYRNGFQGGSVNKIVEAAGITKGALFHHFPGKRELAFAVIDEIIEPVLRQRWLDQLADSSDPIMSMQQTIRHLVKNDIQSGHWLQGCPLNNLAQEMSPLDEGFRERIDGLYDVWRKGIAEALTHGRAAGTVRKDVPAREVAALIVAAQMGIWGTGKSSRNEDLMIQAGDALCGYLETLKASKREEAST